MTIATESKPFVPFIPYTVKAPEGDCPKCGLPDAWIGTRPRYQAAKYIPSDRGDVGVIPARLEWLCATCGYIRETLPLDAPDLTHTVCAEPIRAALS